MFNRSSFLRISIASLAPMALAASAAYQVSIEPTFSSSCFLLSVTLLLASIFVLVFRRVLLACFLAALITSLICGVSYFKQRLMHLGLHAYDFVLYANLETLEFLWRGYRVYLLSLILILFGVVLLVIVIWRFDFTRLSRVFSGPLFAVAMGLVLLLGNSVNSSRPTWEMFTATPPISFFYLSLSETLDSLWTGQIMEADTATTLPSFAPMPRCTLSRDTPNVLLIHQESLFPPSLFPTLSYDHDLDSFFLSDDQKLHKLKVEIYGGGSWMSDISVLTGLSVRSFGAMGAFLQVFLRGKLKETMPQVFSACGFRNQLFFPMDKEFVSMDRFYQSIGFDHIFDKKMQGSTNFRERDRFYFANALDEIDRELRLEDTPTFTYVQTMASHGPYNSAFMPNEEVPGGGPGTSLELNEYLRRLAMAKLDYEFLVSEIKRRFPGRPFLIVRYGDHQPSETEPILALSPAPDARQLTFYAVTGVNYVVPPLPQYDSLGIPFLGMIMLDAARIPLPESYNARKEIMRACGGRYYDCERRQDVLAFQGQMIHSGLVKTP